jgi:hypothetical protein
MSEEKRGISAKDFLVFVPAAASAMALSWEVGSFLPIGGGSFMLFTLTEHLLFAVQALPLTLVIASCIILGIAMSKPMEPIADKSLKKIESPDIPSNADPDVRLAMLRKRVSRLKLGILGARLALIALGMIFIFTGFRFPLAIFIISGLGTAVAAVLIETSPKSTQPRLVAWLLIVGLGIAMAFGSDYSRLALNNDRNIVDIKVRQVTKKAVLVRSGERGVLLYEPQIGRFSVEKWDAVEGLDWERAPLWRMLFKDS